MRTPWSENSISSHGNLYHNVLTLKFNCRHNFFYGTIEDWKATELLRKTNKIGGNMPSGFKICGNTWIFFKKGTILA